MAPGDPLYHCEAFKVFEIGTGVQKNHRMLLGRPFEIVGF